MTRRLADACLTPYPVMAVLAVALWYGAPGLAGVSDWLAGGPLSGLAEAIAALRP